MLLATDTGCIPDWHFLLVLNRGGGSSSNNVLGSTYFECCRKTMEMYYVLSRCTARVALNVYVTLNQSTIRS